MNRPSTLDLAWTSVKGGELCDVMVNVLDCDIIVSKFELKYRCCVHLRTNTFGKSINPVITPNMGKIVQLLFLYNNGFGIK